MNGVYKVKYWETWSFNESIACLNSMRVSASNAKDAIRIVEKLAFEENRAEWIQEPDEENGLTETIVHKLESISIHEVIFKGRLDNEPNHEKK